MTTAFVSCNRIAWCNFLINTHVCCFHGLCGAQNVELIHRLQSAYGPKKVIYYNGTITTTFDSHSTGQRVRVFVGRSNFESDYDFIGQRVQCGGFLLARAANANFWIPITLSRIYYLFFGQPGA